MVFLTNTRKSMKHLSMAIGPTAQQKVVSVVSPLGCNRRCKSCKSCMGCLKLNDGHWSVAA